MKLQRALPPGGPLLLVISLGLASIFAAAAVGKLVKLPDFLKVVDALGLFPGPWQPLLTFVLIGLELTVAICLVVPSLRLIGAVLATGLLTFFVGLVSYAVNDGLNISCGCFTFLRDRSFSVGLLVQDLVLLAVTVFLAVRLTRRDDAPPKPA